MKHNLYCLAILILCATVNLSAQENLSSLTNKQKTIEHSAAAGTFTYFNAIAANNRVTLNWAVGNNNGMDRFEIEKSTDGKTFSMIALVFGSELAESADYEFFEKLKKTKPYYRVKVIYKDNRTEYSSVVIPEAYTASN